MGHKKRKEDQSPIKRELITIKRRMGGGFAGPRWAEGNKPVGEGGALFIRAISHLKQGRSIYKEKT